MYFFQGKRTRARATREGTKRARKTPQRERNPCERGPSRRTESSGRVTGRASSPSSPTPTVRVRPTTRPAPTSSAPPVPTVPALPGSPHGPVRTVSPSPPSAPAPTPPRAPHASPHLFRGRTYIFSDYSKSTNSYTRSSNRSGSSA